MLGLSLSHRLEQKLEHKLNLSHEQRLRLRTHVFSLKIELIEALRAERYNPSGECPRCMHKLTHVEILSGFNRDPEDYTTKCPRCNTRFEPRLIMFGNDVRVELPFYCDCQALSKLMVIGAQTAEELSRQYPAVYRTCIVHHGSIKAAYKAINIDYPYEEISDWISKVTPFLGRLQDTEIARCAGVSVYKVRKLRHSMDIPRYTTEKAFTESMNLDDDYYDD